MMHAALAAVRYLYAAHLHFDMDQAFLKFCFCQPLRALHLKLFLAAMTKRSADEMSVDSQSQSHSANEMGARRSVSAPRQNRQWPNCELWFTGSHRWPKYTDSSGETYPRDVEEFHVQA